MLSQSLPSPIKTKNNDQPADLQFSRGDVVEDRSEYARVGGLKSIDALRLGEQEQRLARYVMCLFLLDDPLG